MTSALRQPVDSPKTVAQALTIYCDELMHLTWHSQDLKCPACEDNLLLEAGCHDHDQHLLCSQCGHEFDGVIDLSAKPEKSGSHNRVSLIRSTVLRVLTRGWGGPVPAKRRMNEAEQSAALAFLASIEIDALLQAEEVLEKGLKALDIAASSHKVYRYQFRQWVAWLERQDWLSPQVVTQQPRTGGQPIGTFANRYKHRVPGRKRSQRFKNQRPQKPVYALRDHEVNEALRLELEAFRQFHRKLAKDTIASYVTELRKLLGWQHRFEGVPLEHLSLAKLIPFVPLKPCHSDIVAEVGQDEDAYLKVLVQQQQELDHQGLLAAQQVEQILERYFEFQAECVGTQVQITHVFCSLAQFVYWEDIQRLGLDRRAYSQIPVLKRLRAIRTARSKVKQDTPPAIPLEDRSISWRQVFEVLKQQQRKADEPYHYYAIVRNGKEYQCRNKRSKTAMAKDLQTFLLVLFFVAVPPGRTQGVQALELGKTLKQGIFEAGEFIPVERLADPKLAKWFIQLRPNQYKSGKSHGTYWGEVPNVPLGEGKAFYDYLEQWIERDRLVFEPDHNFLFVKTVKRRNVQIGGPITKSSVKQLVRGAFSIYSGVPVSPQTCRTMFVTYLNQVGASESELEAAATAMRHHRSTQRKHYDRLDKVTKVQPVMEFNRALFASTDSASAETTALPMTAGGWLDYRQLTDQQLQQLLQQLKRPSKVV